MSEGMVLVAVTLAGALVATMVMMVWQRRSTVSSAQSGGDQVSVDIHHVLDLVRRVHDALAVCAITDNEYPVIAVCDPRPAQELLDRAVGVAREAMRDRRDHVVMTGPEIIAVGDGRLGVSMILESGQRASGAKAENVAADLRRLVAGFRVGRGSSQALRGNTQEAVEGALSRLESVEGLATALCEAASTMARLPTAIVIRDLLTNSAVVVAVSRVSDHRLVGSRVTAESACGRAIMGRMTAAGNDIQELMGGPGGDRRRRNEPGIAFPLHDGREGIGALVVFGQPDAIEPAIRDRVAAIGLEMAPHLGAAAAVRAAESRSMTDELTGLPNRLVLERVMSQIGNRNGSLLIVGVDPYRKLNDGFGHAAGDAALRHVGQILVHSLRDGDMAARNAEEEFALWLVGAGKAPAVEVAARVRRAVAAETFRWAGADLKITCSVGIACYPETAADLADVRLAAGAAARRARDGGGDRVELAPLPRG